MKKPIRCALTVFACVLAGGWLLATPGVASAGTADFPNGSRNMELVGAGLQGVPLSKLAPWPRTDGRYFYSGGYQQTEGSFWVIDVKDHENPVGYETPAYDKILSPAPPRPHPIWNSPAFDYTNDPYNPATGVGLKSPCGDWIPYWKSLEPGETPIDPNAVLPTCWDPGWITRTHFTAYGTGKVLAVNAQRNGFASPNRIGWTGISTWDISDPKNAKLLGRWNAPYQRASGTLPTNHEYVGQTSLIFSRHGGVHHFFYDGRYAFLGSEYAGFDNRILVIVDLHDPKNIVEAGKWWVPGQKDGEVKNWVNNNSFSNVIKYDTNQPTKLRKYVGLHYAAVQGNIAYLSWHQAGLIILDVRDKANPQFLSRLDYMTPEFQASEPQSGLPSPDHAACNINNGFPAVGVGAACGNAHSGKLVPGAGGLLAMTDEYFQCPYGHLRLIDVSDPGAPFIVSHQILPPLQGETVSRTLDCTFKTTDYSSRTPSTHLPTAVNNNMLFVAWYGAGLRAIDISDPYNPTEVGYYQYNIPDGGAGTYDVLFGPGGLLYSSDETDGVRVIEYTGTGKSGKP